MIPYLYKDHKIIRRDKCFISIDDRSFRFGDGVFETIPFFNKKCLFLDKHISRLENILGKLKIELRLEKIAFEVSTLIKKSKLENGIIRIICSRGKGSIGFLPSTNCKPYYILDCQANHFLKPKQVNLWITKYKSISNANFSREGKTNNSLNAILARLEAQENDCFEAIYKNSKNHFIECSSSNFCLLINKQLFFPKDDPSKMNGLTEAFFKTFNDCLEKNICIEDLLSADRCYIMNSGWGILPVDSIQSLGKKFNTIHDDTFIKEFWTEIKKECDV